MPPEQGWHDQLYQGSSGNLNSHHDHGVITGCEAYPLAA